MEGSPRCKCPGHRIVLGSDGGKHRQEHRQKAYLPLMPFRNSLRDISKAAARAAKWRSPTSRAPRSRSEI